MDAVVHAEHAQEASSLRRIAPIKIQGWAPPAGPPALGPRPEVRWVAPTDLWVDAAYQRDLTPRSVKLIKRGCMGFSWARMQWPKGVLVEGKIHLINGQHTAVMAAILGIPEIPVVVDGVSSVESRATAFVSLNQDRVGMTAFDLHRAGVAAGIPEDLAMEEVLTASCSRVRLMSQTTRARPGDTSAVTTVRRMVERRGVKFGIRVMRAFVMAKIGPISASELQAAEMLAARRRGASSEELARAFERVPVLDTRLEAARQKRPCKHLLLERYEKILGPAS